MRDDVVGVEAVRIALLREEGHRERLQPTAPSAVLERIRKMWAREQERQQERKKKMAPFVRRQA